MTRRLGLAGLGRRAAKNSERSHPGHPAAPQGGGESGGERRSQLTAVSGTPINRLCLPGRARESALLQVRFVYFFAPRTAVIPAVRIREGSPVWCVSASVNVCVSPAHFLEVANSSGVCGPPSAGLACAHKPWYYRGQECRRGMRPPAFSVSTKHLLRCSRTGDTPSETSRLWGGQ